VIIYVLVVYLTMLTVAFTTQRFMVGSLVSVMNWNGLWSNFIYDTLDNLEGMGKARKVLVRTGDVQLEI